VTLVGRAEFRQFRQDLLATGVAGGTCSTTTATTVVGGRSSRRG
jgi:hypothetical protein